MPSIAAVLDQALRSANIPIIGVSLEDLTNRATWRVLFLPAATPADKVAAQTIVDTVAIDAATLADLDVLTDADQKAIKTTVITALWGRLGRQPTVPEIAAERTRWINVFKALP